MDLYKEIYQPYDISFKYSILVMNRYLHQYLELENDFIRSYPTEVITKDMRNLRMDGLYETSGKTLNNIEAQSKTTYKNDLKRFNDYKCFAESTYGLPVNTIIITTIDPDKCAKEFKNSQTDILRPIYIHFSEKELIEKYNNIEEQLNNNQTLSKKEILDMAFIPLFMPSEKGEEITESMCKLLKRVNLVEYDLKRDVSFILQVMIYKHIQDIDKREKLLEGLNMKQFKTDLEYIAYEINGNKLEEQQAIIELQEEQMEKMKKEQTEKINKMEKEQTEKINEIKKVLNEIKESDSRENTKALINKLLLNI